MTDVTVRSRHTPMVHLSASGMLDRLNAVETFVDPSVGELPTGFDPLDEVLDGGLNVGDLCVLGGAPGVGKTILALQMARNMAVAGKHVLYCCYEHDVPTLLGRLVSLEIGNLGARIAPDEESLMRSSIKAIMAGRWSLAHPGAKHPVLRAAMAQVQSYGDNLMLAQLSTAMAGLDVIHGRMLEAPTPYQAVFVDYLQKIGIQGTTAGIERWTVAVEELKDIALTEGCLMVAISALDQDSLKARRVTLDGFRGAHAIAHEADVAIVLNSKLKVVSRAHLAYATTLYDEFNRATVLTIEKNRRGLAPLDMEFVKDFSRFRFIPDGKFVAERLIDDVLVDE